MTAHVLDNPIWASLTTRHRSLAEGTGDVLRYPARVAPFLGVPGSGPIAKDALERLVPAGDTVLMLGPRPSVPGGYRLEDLGLLSQMICDARLPAVDGPAIVPLNDDHPEKVLELTALVYPHYFRPRTMELGRYFGILEGGRLAAMIGERMGTDGFREISAVCNHPDFTGRGYARRLVTFLVNDLFDRGEVPFLHVSPKNTHAKALYERNGFRTRLEIPFWSTVRAP